MSAFSEDVTTTSSDAQMCGLSSGSEEAATHAMRRIFQHENLDAIILVDQTLSKTWIEKHFYCITHFQKLGSKSISIV